MRLGVEHSVPNGQSSLFLQLHPTSSLLFGFKTDLLCEDIIGPIVFIQLLLTLIVFLLKILASFSSSAKCFFTSFKKLCPRWF